MLLYHTRKSSLIKELQSCLIQRLNNIVKDPNCFHCSVILRMLMLTSDWPCLVTKWMRRSSGVRHFSVQGKRRIVSSSYVPFLRSKESFSVILQHFSPPPPPPQHFARNGSDRHAHVNYCQRESDPHIFLGLQIGSFLLESCGQEVDIWTQLGVYQHGYCGVKE